MNTIPLTFNEHQVTRTILGGAENTSENKMDISVILLNSTGSHFKMKIFDELMKCNFDSIISIEPDVGNYNIEEISRHYPNVKFIIPHETVSDGENINIGMAEIKSTYVLVLKDDLYIPSGILLPNLAENLTSEKLLCLAPRLVDSKKNSLPIKKSPFVERSKFIVDSSTQVSAQMNTLYPFDYIGLYHREKFIEIGGFDYTISSPYWQLLDFGVRAWLWGEKIKITTALQLSYTQDENLIEDKTPGLDSLRFYLKNELPLYKDDYAFVKKIHFWRFFKHSGCGILEARRQFLDAVSWVDINKFKFKTDVLGLIENWK